MHHAARRGRTIVSVLCALLCGGAIGAQSVSIRATGAARPPVPLRTRWPSTTAISIVAGDNPVSVEATGDGWVVLTPVGVWARPFDGLSATRLEATPAGVRNWLSAVRSGLAIVRDTAAKGRPLPRLPQLGRGLANIAGGAPTRGTDRTMFRLQRCDGAGGYLSLTKEDLDVFLAVLERAAKVAEQESPRPIPPTLDRPYYPSEVSCAAAPMVRNAPARFPAGIPASPRRYADVGVRFVVDTSGFVEAGSVTTLPGAPPALDRAARELVSHWRFRAAVRGGAPVRQVVSTAVTFDPSQPELASRPSRGPTRYVAQGYGLSEVGRFDDLAEQRAYLATSDGWVRLRVGTWNSLGAFSGAQEWFSPDSVDAWAARTRIYVTTDSARVRRPKTYSADRATTLSQPFGNEYEVRYMTGAGRDTGWAPWGQMHGCGGATYRAEVIDALVIEKYVAAARTARAERATPREPGDSVYARGDVACPAFLRDVRVLQEELNIYRQPRAPIPPSMESVNARAEVLTSFVVDTAGMPKPSTLIAMPGSDPRAVAALRAQLDRYRFEPATRSGVPVNALVIRNWSFEPRPRCRDTYDGLDCPRVYSKTSER
jgi:TonB family protein